MNSYPQTHAPLSCPGSQPWTIYLTASVREFREVLVLTRPVPRGSAIAASDLRSEVRDTTSLRGGYLVDPAAAARSASSPNGSCDSGPHNPQEAPHENRPGTDREPARR